MDILLWIIAILLVVIGLVGIIVPGIPGTMAVFAGLFIAAWADDFTRVGWTTITVLGLITLGSLALDVLMTSLGAKRMKASTPAVLGAAVGMLIGLFFGIVGIVVGPFIGAFLGELLAHRELLRAAKVGAATWVGLLASLVMKLWVAFAMIGIFVLAYVL